MAQRGEVWWVKLDPTVGQEIQKTRPCLIVSPEDFTPYDLIMVVPLTTGGRPAPYRPRTRFGGRVGLVLPEQIRTVSRARLMGRSGLIEAEVLIETLTVLREMFEA